MSVQACDLYRIEVPSDKVLFVLAQLQLLSAFEPIKPLFPVDDSSYIAELQHISQTKTKVNEVLSVLHSQTTKTKKSSKPVITTDLTLEIEKTIPDLEQVLVTIFEFAEKITEITTNIEKSIQDISILELLKDSTLSLFSKNGLVSGFILQIATAQTVGFERAMKEVGAVEFSLLAHTSEKNIYGVLIESEAASALTDVLTQPYCEQIRLPEFITAVSPANAYKQYTQYLTNLKTTKAELEKKLSQLADKYVPQLSVWYDLLLIKEAALKNSEFVGFTPGSNANIRGLDEAVTQQLQTLSKSSNSLLHGLTQTELLHIDGWIAPAEVSSLVESLSKFGSSVTVTRLVSQDDPEVRTILKNNAAIRPFELVTNLMGMPSTQELDPSPYVAPFFILFFGFALGDAGYGLIMIALVLYVLRKPSQVSAQMRNAALLVLYCGISTTFFGIITGSWFGVNLTAFGPAGLFLQKLKLIDLQANIILMLVLSLIIGFIHQLFGLVLAIKSSVQAGKIAEAIQIHGTWMLLLMSFVFSASITYVPALQPLSFLSTPALVGAFICFVFGQGLGAPWWLRPFKGILSVFNLTGYLSNTLSYARLIALALATGVIASVVNLIAVMAGGSLPLIPGLFVIGFVAIIGHTFNIMLNLLGTFITVARLHLVEFFPRFFEAKGIGLNPLTTDSMYSNFSDSFSVKSLQFNQVTLQSTKE